MTEKTNENQGQAQPGSPFLVASFESAEKPVVEANAASQQQRRPEDDIRAEEAARRVASFKEFMRENIEWLSKELDLHRQGFSSEHRVDLNP